MNLEYSQNTTGIVYKRMRLYQTKKWYIVLGYSKYEKEYKLLYLQRTALDKQQDFNEKDLSKVVHEDSQKFSSLQEAEASFRKDESTKSFSFMCKFYGIIGFFKFLEGYYFHIITSIEKIARLGRHKLWKIQKTQVIRLFDQKHSSKDEIQFQNQLASYDMSQGFYSSYSYDLTNSLSKNMLRNAMDIADAQTNYSKKRQLDRQFSSCKDLGHACEVFTWNYYAIATFYGLIKNKKWIVSIMHGYLEQRNLKSLNSSFSITIIARRCRHHAGTRFSKRGINEEGFAANFVESEQIVIDLESTQRKPSCTSFIQIRGSAPVFWHQDPSILNVKPPIQLNQCDPYYSATKKHFGDLYARYGQKIFCMDLVKSCQTQTNEEKLAQKYSQVIDEVNSEIDFKNQITYFHFDMKKQLKTDKTEYVEKSYTYAYFVVRQMGVFWVQDSKRAKVEQCVEMQNGILRSNCVDCLDRTNSFQQLVGEVALAVQLGKMFCSPLKFSELNVHEKVLGYYRGMFERMGDVISEQYGSSKAHKQNIKEQKNTKWRFELFTSIERHFKNNLSDSARQFGIDLFLGNFIPDMNQKTWQNPNKQFFPKDGFENLVFKNPPICVHNYTLVNQIQAQIPKDTSNSEQNTSHNLTFYLPDQPNNINNTTQNSNNSYNIYYNHCSLPNNNNNSKAPRNLSSQANNNNNNNPNSYINLTFNNNNVSNLNNSMNSLASNSNTVLGNNDNSSSILNQNQTPLVNANNILSPQFNIIPSQRNSSASNNTFRNSIFSNPSKPGEMSFNPNLTNLANVNMNNANNNNNINGNALSNRVNSVFNQPNNNLTCLSEMDGEYDRDGNWWMRSIQFFREDNYVNVLLKIMQEKARFTPEQQYRANLSLFKDYQLPMNNQRNKFAFKKFQIEFINIINKYDKSKLYQDSQSIKLVLTLPKNYLFMNFINSFQKISRKDFTEKLKKEYNRTTHLFPDQEIQLFSEPQLISTNQSEIGSARPSDVQTRLSGKRVVSEQLDNGIKQIMPTNAFRTSSVNKNSVSREQFLADDKRTQEILEKGEEYEEERKLDTIEAIENDFPSTNALSRYKHESEDMNHEIFQLAPLTHSQKPQYHDTDLSAISPTNFNQKSSQFQQSIGVSPSSHLLRAYSANTKNNYSAGQPGIGNFQDQSELTLFENNLIDEYLSLNPTSNIGVMMNEKDGNTTRKRKNIYNGKTTQKNMWQQQQGDAANQGEQAVARSNLIEEYFSELNLMNGSKKEGERVESYFDYFKESNKNQPSSAFMMNSYFDYNNMNYQMKQSTSKIKCAQCFNDYEQQYQRDSQQPQYYNLEKNLKGQSLPDLTTRGNRAGTDLFRIDSDWIDKQGQLTCHHSESQKYINGSNANNGFMEKDGNNMSGMDSDDDRDSQLSREEKNQELNLNEEEMSNKKNILLLEMLVKRNFIFPQNTVINVV